MDKSLLRPKPSIDWLTDRMWVNLLSLSYHFFGQDKEQFFKNLPDILSSS